MKEPERANLTNEQTKAWTNEGNGTTSEWTKERANELTNERITWNELNINSRGGFSISFLFANRN